ncbi:ribose 5-phosphate isomerase B [Planctomicrobium piriforme]|uniref:Ribose 5-phosphate isomerase B n=1 Tax=Planctomicrobium piriforme TaxID=1576369 RepID=A0A1I3F9B8_9PLAN|nr:ribose 5-phosphate isomerase B [Planctomicrobium piriforme]SFI07789.1 ribose 5-phosphate isomerase B [Planctomicrobium piriforme]
MRVAIASDHRGVRVKSQIMTQVKELGHVGLDFGPAEAKSVDYPDYAFKVSEAVSTGEVDRGILICGTGMGMCIAANKFAGVRAVTCHDDVTAEYSRRHNNANVMCLSADMLGDRLLGRIVEIWLRTEFEGGRHQRRLEKIAKFEETHGATSHLLNGAGCCNGDAAVEPAAAAPTT